MKTAVDRFNDEYERWSIAVGWGRFPSPNGFR
jgi:hypothetical protein